MWTRELHTHRHAYTYTYKNVGIMIWNACTNSCSITFVLTVAVSLYDYMYQLSNQIYYFFTNIDQYSFTLNPFNLFSNVNYFVSIEMIV